MLLEFLALAGREPGRLLGEEVLHVRFAARVPLTVDDGGLDDEVRDREADGEEQQRHEDVDQEDFHGGILSVWG